MWTLTVILIGCFWANAGAISEGYEVQEREKVDTDKRVTFVDTENTFAVDGVIDAIEFYAADNTVDRVVRVGVYEKMEGDCQFKMLKMVQLTISETGIQTIPLNADQQLAVSAGQHFGFTFTHYGVIEYDKVDHDNYCIGRRKKPNEGDEVVLSYKKRNARQRKYSIRLHYQNLACAVIGARESGSSRLYVFFRDNTLWKFSFNTEDILTASYYSEKDIFTYYPGLNGRYPDSGCMFDGNVQFFFFGDQVELHEYNDGRYEILDGYPKTIANYLNQTTTPTQVSACAPDFADDTLYLFNGDIVYHYSMSGSFPDITYAYNGQFDMGVNSATNPFSAQPGSPLASPPTGLTAAVFREYGDEMLAFANTSLYMFTKSSGHWEYIGEIETPCD